MSVLLPFRILGIMMMMIGTFSAVIIITAHFFEYLIIPDVLQEWGLDTEQLSNSFVLWVLFLVTFGTGYFLMNCSTEQEKRPELLMVTSGIMLFLGSVVGVCLFMDQTGIISTDNSTQLWLLLIITYLVGFQGIRRAAPKMDELMKQDQERFRKVNEAAEKKSEGEEEATRDGLPPEADRKAFKDYLV